MSTQHADTVADLTTRVADYRERACRMGRGGYRDHAADWHKWADEAQHDLDTLTAAVPRWTLQQWLEVVASVVFAEGVFAVVLWAAVLR